MFIIWLNFCLIAWFTSASFTRESSWGSKTHVNKVCFCDSYSVLFFRVKDFSRTHVQLKERLAAYNVDSSPDQSAGKCYIGEIFLKSFIMIFTQLSCNVRKITVDDMGILFANRIIYDLVWGILFLLFFFIKSIIREQNIVMYIHKNFPCYKHQVKFPLEIQQN